MSSYPSKKVKLFYNQINQGTPEEVFPLLCPVREKDWLDGWDHTMIYSESGLIEKGCVFSTPHHGEQDTIWTVTQHDPKNYLLEFVRLTPGDSVVQISIQLEAVNTDSTRAKITYEYTSLSEAQSRYLETDLPSDFRQSMEWWEKAINYYLQNGEMLKK